MPTKQSIYIHFICIVVFLSLTAITFSQDIPGCDLRFIDHLVNKGYFEEALFLLDSQECSSLQLNDSVDYFRGWSLYSLNRLIPSSESLIKIPPTSSFYPKSHFYAAYNYTQSGNFDQATETLDKIEMSTSRLISLRDFEIAGIELLRGNLSSFDEWFNNTRFDQPELNESAGKLLKISDEVRNHRSKSPLVAGLLSAIIRGSGKLYAGKKGEAVATFLSTAWIGFVTWENYRKCGLKSFRTITFGTFFAGAYASNIYGSVFSVSVVENNYRENVKSTILFNMHIPINTIFNK